MTKPNIIIIKMLFSTVNKVGKKRFIFHIGHKMKKKKQNGKTQKSYSQQMLEAAYKDVKENKMPIRKAARLHLVPESTLRFRLKHFRGLDVKGGSPTIFTRKQEEALAEHCIHMAHIGYGMTRWQILDMAKNMCEVTGKKNSPTKHWFYGFLKRFPELKMVNPKKREKSRTMLTDETLNRYFAELEITMTKYGVKDKAANIWNVDETGISLDHNPPKVLARSGTSPHSITSGRSANTTAIAAVGALGQTIPPYVIFKGERISKEMMSSGLKGTVYKTSTSGWSNSELFLDFFNNHFLKHVTVRPCLLLYDGHSTHVTVDVIQAAREQGVHLFVLPPHSSHCLQPLDISVFGPFKKSLNAECHKFLHEHPNTVVTREELPKMIGNAFSSAMTVSTIMAGFRKSGIFPYSPTAPTVSPPAITKSDERVKASRKERNDNRAVTVLFQGQAEQFEKKKAETEQRKERKKFVPPYGATVTEDSYYTEKQKQQKMKEEKEKKKADESRKCKPSFTTPYLALPGTSTDCEAACSREDGKKDVSGGCVEEDDDDEICVVCKRWLPAALGVDVADKIISWGQCMICDEWVHLKYCTAVEQLSDDDFFTCPICDKQF